MGDDDDDDSIADKFAKASIYSKKYKYESEFIFLLCFHAVNILNKYQICIRIIRGTEKLLGYFLSPSSPFFIDARAKPCGAG